MVKASLESKQSDPKACAFNYSIKQPPSKDDGATGVSYIQIHSPVFFLPQSSHNPEILGQPGDPKVDRAWLTPWRDLFWKTKAGRHTSQKEVSIIKKKSNMEAERPADYLVVYLYLLP